VEPRGVKVAPDDTVSPFQDPSAPAEHSTPDQRPITPILPPASDEEGGQGSMTAAQWAQLKEDAARRASQEAVAKRTSLEFTTRPGSQPGVGVGAGAAGGVAPHPPNSSRPSADGARPGSHLGPSAEGLTPATHQGFNHGVEGPAAAARASTDSYRPCSGCQVELSVGSTRSVRDAPVRPSSGQALEHLGAVAEEEPSAIARISVGSLKGGSGSSHPASGTVGEVLAAADHPPSNSPVARRTSGQSLILGGALHSSHGSRPISTQGAAITSSQGSRPVSTQGAAAAVGAQGSRLVSGAAAPVAPSSQAGSRRSSHVGGVAAAEGVPAVTQQAAVGQLGEQVEEGARPESGRVEGGREEARLNHDSPVRFSHHDSTKHAWGEQ
jgi:hypothetical protein